MVILQKEKLDLSFLLKITELVGEKIILRLITNPFVLFPQASVCSYKILNPEFPLAERLSGCKT